MVTALAAANLLESGDRMPRAEFHRRYEARPDIARAELVEGVVYVPSPTRFDLHDDQAALCVTLLRVYASRHAGVRSGANATLILDELNELQADAFLFRPGSGRLVLRDDHYLEGAPELVVEVAASTVSVDLHDKLRAYERNGVREYVVWRVGDGAIDWFTLRGGRFARRQPVGGLIESEQFPGLRFDLAAMLAGDDAAALAALEGGA